MVHRFAVAVESIYTLGLVVSSRTRDRDPAWAHHSRAYRVQRVLDLGPLGPLGPKGLRALRADLDLGLSPMFWPRHGPTNRLFSGQVPVSPRFEKKARSLRMSLVTRMHESCPAMIVS